MDIGKLDSLYTNAESIDSSIFAEMRSNLLLVSGDHYSKVGKKFRDRINASKANSATKLRLTKNHTATICDKKVGKILSHAPNVMIVPNNEGEMQDQKSAELNNSVWQFAKKEHKIRKKLRSWAEDFVHLGECFVKVTWDADKGEVVGYEQAVDEKGKPQFDKKQVPVETEFGIMMQETKEPKADKKKPVMSGDFDFERLLAFNVLRDPNSQSLEDSPYLIVRRMVDKKKVKGMLEDDRDASLLDNMEETYMVFNGDTASYGEERNKIMLREHYYRPCKQYPEGYFYITVQGLLITEGELPYGLFPIKYAGHTEIPTSARYRSPIKKLRPYQIEINRSASKIAETQITLGDDKIVMSNGSKLGNGGSQAGIRGVTVSGGGNMQVVSGRSGEQYLPYMQSQISEMYMVSSEQELDQSGQFDPMAMLYFSGRNKTQYKKHVEEFEGFLTEMVTLFLDLAKNYYDGERLIPMVGRSEAVNLEEFKNTEALNYQIKVENIGDDHDTLFGKQLSMNHALQYAGGSLDKNDIGKILKAMPYMNQDEAFGDLTIDYDMSKNDMLAMERGNAPISNQYDNHKYLIQKAVNRVKKADFTFLEDNIKQLYSEYIKGHEEAEAQNIKELQRLEAGMIPTGGSQVKADYYIETPEGGTTRATFPQAALRWLEETLQKQGETLQPYEEMGTGVQAQLAGIVNNQQQ